MGLKTQRAGKAPIPCFLHWQDKDAADKDIPVSRRSRNADSPTPPEQHQNFLSFCCPGNWPRENYFCFPSALLFCSPANFLATCLLVSSLTCLSPPILSGHALQPLSSTSYLGRTCLPGLQPRSVLQPVKPWELDPANARGSKILSGLT